jgi:hypothetical protein
MSAGSPVAALPGVEANEVVKQISGHSCGRSGVPDSFTYSKNTTPAPTLSLNGNS